MSSSSFGVLLRVTTFGESHGPCLGAVVDGVPAGVQVTAELVQADLDRRRPGRDPASSPRAESDRVEILSGILDEHTTGAPIALSIANHDARPGDYQELCDVFRPGHGDWTWEQKYGVRDVRGGGRGSGRETAARVAAGAVARQLLATSGVEVVGAAREIAGVGRELTWDEMQSARDQPLRSVQDQTEAMRAAIDAARTDQDSVGGIIEARARGVPPGLGEPVFDKLDARLAAAIMSIGAVKGVEIGAGFAVARMRGSQCNDPMTRDGFATNHAGGVLGGISSGAEIIVRAVVKPTPSIGQPQTTVDRQGRERSLAIEGRHDPCIVPRAVAVVEAMICLALADFLMLQRAKQAGGDR